MTDAEIEKFNSLYNTACEKMKGLIILDGYKPKTLGFFERFRAKKAISYFKQALAIQPKHFASLLFTGKLYQSLGQHHKSLLAFETAMQFEKANHVLPQEASLAAMHLNQFDKALKYSQDAIDRKPNDVALLGNHAMNLLIAGHDTKAKETIDTALLLDPTDVFNRRIKDRVEKVISGQIKRPVF